MASTYSDLKIELIGTGEQVGTWGSTTNTNLGTALEEAIVGSADVSFSSSDVTLTLTNTNGTQAARHIRLNLTGTSGGARNLILGSGCQIDKPYIINNGLADTVTVKNTTGTGVAVPAGKSMWVFNNGTNVVEVMNHSASFTLGTPLVVSSGGTGAATLTGIVKGNGTSAFTAGQVSLTSEVTGTLPIANGGTGSTSTTFVNLATNVTGTLPIANGGTGATTLTANNVILGNGTSAPLFVAPGSSGNVLTSNGTTWTSTAGYAPYYAQFVEEQAQGVGSSTANSTSFVTRVLNTTKTNNITSASLSSNRVSLPAGSYWMIGVATAVGLYNSGRGAIYNHTDSTYVAYSANSFSRSSNDILDALIMTQMVTWTFVTIAGTKEFELRSINTTAYSTGFDNNFSGVPEIYSIFNIWKVA